MRHANHAPAKPVIDRASVKLKTALECLDWQLLTRLCQQTLRKDPEHVSAHRFLGFSLSKQHRTDEALNAFRRALVYLPDDAELLANFGHFLTDQAQNLEALPLLEKLCRLSPGKAVCWSELAYCCYAIGRHEKGFEAAEKAAELAVDPNEKLAALIQKAIHRRELGQVKEAVLDCEAAIELNPFGVAGYTNRMLFMLADPSTSPEQLYKASRAYAEVFEQPLIAQWPDFRHQAGGPWRRLHIGFLSPDFRSHPVMYFLEGLLAQLDRRQFEISSFYLYPADDTVTKRVQRHSDQFFKLADKTTNEQIQTIRDARIDILIDLAGHTGHNGLLVLARKAAPLQISWLGYPATTGLQAVDYKFTDEVTDPPDSDSQYSEKLYRMPTFFACYRPLIREPLWRYQPRYQVRSTPALENGYITFGSCNNLGKLTDDVLKLWGQILEALPNAHLLIEGKNLGESQFREQYVLRCENLGIDSRRLILVDLNGFNQYLTYHRIDIALDPFPLTGGTTSFDLLWMGVPLVSMVGDSFKSRMGTGLLTYLNKEAWLANNHEEYIKIALGLAQDISKLNAIRMGMREEMEKSALMRDDLFCNHFGNGLRTIWLHWLANTIYPGNAKEQTRQIRDWQTAKPIAWQKRAAPEVGWSNGNRISLSQAHELLIKALDAAKFALPQVTQSGGLISHKCWIEVTERAEKILTSVPHDAVALACLAEVEHAHGHTDFAVTYLRYAQKAMTATH